MTVASPPRMDAAELARLLQAADPAVLLVPPRLLRRVIKLDRHVTSLGLQVPHHRSYVIARERLLAAVTPDELGLPPASEPAPTAILIAAPSPGSLAEVPPELALVKYWRTLFHARVHLELDRRLADVPDADIAGRVRAVGAAEFAEARAVLKHDEYLLPPGDDRTAYVEFAAVYLELRYFAGTLLPRYFPDLGRSARIDRLLAADVDADALFAATRPAGAPDPVVPEEPAEEDIEAGPPAPPEPSGPSFDTYCRLVRRAKRASKRGNGVRAVIARAAAASVAPPDRREEAAAAVRAELDRLTARLQAALALDPKGADRWRSILAALASPAAAGVWPPEARLLYDLQRVCIDHERALYALDPVGWLRSFGRRPLRRPVPCQQQVLQLRHLRTALGRVKSARLTERGRRRLYALLQDAIHAAERRLRDGFRPAIRAALHDVGMEPRNLPEQVALNKLTEELLDRIGGRGFVTMGDLRDAVSRNNLKLPDLRGPREFFGGDRLLRADRQLARALDGVYRRGEFYLRWLQRLSALGFGTRVGRFLTRYAVLPFGGAFVLLEGVHHVAKPLLVAFGVIPPRQHLHWVNRWSVSVLGLFFMGLLYAPAFRRLVLRALWLAGAAVRAVFVDLPAFVLRLPPVRALLASRPWQIFSRRLLKPLLGGALAFALVRLLGRGAEPAASVGGSAFGALAIFYNTRLGRDIDEAVTDWLVRTWQRLHFDLVPGLFRLVTAFFRRTLEEVDRALYRVDEWLRFRHGESRLMLAEKVVLGFVWFYVAYVARFCVNLLIEPQVNPIKHFPVVTVSHKLVLTLVVPRLAQVLELTMEPARAVATAFTIGFMIPGIFGFLVWEFKENWRLYRANLPPTLRPVPIGHHGETMLRLLRPGFHSGTLPKVYARLRRAERTAHRTGDWSGVRRQREALEAVEESVRHFIDRELVYLLNASGRLGSACLATGAVTLTTNRVRVELPCPDQGAALVLVFEEHPDGLAAGVVEPGWLPRLGPDQAQAVQTALAGLYRMAGVTRELPAAADIDAIPDAPLAWQDWVRSWKTPLAEAVPPANGADGVVAQPADGSADRSHEATRSASSSRAPV